MSKMVGRSLEIPDALFMGSTIVSFLLLILLAPFQEGVPFNSVLADVSYFFDVVQVLSFVLVVVLFSFWFANPKDLEKTSKEDENTEMEENGKN